MLVSLIITTYRWPEALIVTLRSALRQSCSDYEVIIADDGSGAPTAEAVSMVMKSSQIPWRHVWHEDHGIRQARIKNLAVKFARGDYFVFIDHDVVLHPDFLKDHVRLADESCFLQGKRVFLSQTLTAGCLAQGWLDPPSPFTRGLGNRKNAFRFSGIGKWLARRKNFQTSLRGCNLSMSRSRFLLVDGYDELFDGIWGREDSDICYRLFNSGCHLRNLWFSGLQYHLHHTSIKRKERDRLDIELEKNLTEKRTSAVIGYSKLSSEGKIIGGG